MPLLRLIGLILLGHAGLAQAVERASPEQTAIRLRQIRDQIDASPTNVELYQRYVDAFPSSLAQLSEVLVVPTYQEILLRSDDETWSVGAPYVNLMCRSYAQVNHRRYMRKLLRIGVTANDWGGSDKDRDLDLFPGYLYQALIYPNCGERGRTKEEADEQESMIYSLLPEFTDTEIEAIYNSLSWVDDAGMDKKLPLGWFLKGICSRYPNRCPLTQAIRKKYAKYFVADPRPH